MTSRASASILAGALLIVGIAWVISSTPHSHASAVGTLGGYAWSDTVGWISMSGSNYGLSIGSAGDVSGYAWSEHLGWVSANAADLSGCPSAPCTATLSGGALSGWLKALAADSNGWDGWIRLSGTGYGPSESNGIFSGYAWGSDVVGWISFSNVTAACTQAYSCSDPHTIVALSNSCIVTTTSCPAPSFCSAGYPSCLYPAPEYNSVGGLTGHLQVTPLIVPQGTNATATWNIGNVASCTVSSDQGGGPWSDYDASTHTSAGTHAATIDQQTTYTLSCSGLDSSNIHETVVVGILPIFQER